MWCFIAIPLVLLAIVWLCNKFNFSIIPKNLRLPAPPVEKDKFTKMWRQMPNIHRVVEPETEDGIDVTGRSDIKWKVVKHS